jgi:hypothetical protein
MAAKEITASVTGHTWGTAALASVEFIPDQVSVVNMSTTAADNIYVSFDNGNSVAATLTPGSAQAGYSFEVSAQKVWLRRVLAGAAVECRVVFTKKV